MERRGLVMVFTGNGKGKTTAALGMGLRAWGHGLRVLVLQFVKGSEWESGELLAAGKMGSGFEIRRLGEGFVGGGEKSVARHRRAAEAAMSEAREEIFSDRYDMIVLDEVIFAVSRGLIRENELLDLIREKPPHLHLVLTGRGVPPGIVEAADLVTEMTEIKHPFAAGIPAQKGVEF